MVDNMPLYCCPLKVCVHTRHESYKMRSSKVHTRCGNRIAAMVGRKTGED